MVDVGVPWYLFDLSEMTLSQRYMQGQCVTTTLKSLFVL
jgi:hypothetical protein